MIGKLYMDIIEKIEIIKKTMDEIANIMERRMMTLTRGVAMEKVMVRVTVNTANEVTRTK